MALAQSLGRGKQVSYVQPELQNWTGAGCALNIIKLIEKAQSFATLLKI